MIAQNDQEPPEQAVGLGVDHIMLMRTAVIGVGVAVGIVFPVINAAGGNPVAEHLHNIVQRHFDPAHFMIARRRVVDPVFDMVLVAALMVEPCLAVSELGAFGGVRAFVPLVIPDAR